MTQAGVAVIGPAQHQDHHAVVPLRLVQQFPATLLQYRVAVGHGRPALFTGPVVLVHGDAEPLSPGGKHLLAQQRRVLEVQGSVHVSHPRLGKKILFLGEGRMHHLGGACDHRAGAGGLGVGNEGVHVGQAGEPDMVQRLAHLFLVQQVVHMGQRHLGGITGVDGAVLAALAPQLLRGGIGEHHVARRDAQHLQIGAHERRDHVDIERPGDADAHRVASLRRCLGAAFKRPAQRASPHRAITEPAAPHLLVVHRQPRRRQR